MSYQPKVVFHPGIHLAEELEARTITQKNFAHVLGISTGAMSLIMSGKRDISTKLAVRIGEALGTWPELWLNSQTRYNLWKFKQNKQEVQYLSLIKDKMLNYDVAIA